MKIDQLRYFLETARTEHVGKAARALAISPSAISHSIAELEDALGRKLFTKEGKFIALTSHGKMFAERVEVILRDLDKLKEDLSSDGVELKGNLRIAGTHSLVDQTLVPAWLNLQKKHPKLTCEIYSYRSAEVLQRVATGELDCGICFSPQDSPKINRDIVWNGELELVARKKHPLHAMPRSAQTKRLQHFPAAMPKAFQGIESCETHPSLLKLGISPNAAFVYDSYTVALNSLLSSDMWSLIPSVLLRDFEKELDVLRPKDWTSPPVNVSFVWPKNRIMTSILKLLKQEISQQMVL